MSDLSNGVGVISAYLQRLEKEKGDKYAAAVAVMDTLNTAYRFMADTQSPLKAAAFEGMIRLSYPALLREIGLSAEEVSKDAAAMHNALIEEMRCPGPSTDH